MRTIACGCALFVACSACTGGSAENGSADADCSHWKTALVGTAVGGGIGAAVGGTRGAAFGGLTGAAAGAIACEIYIRYHSEQVQSDQQTNAKYVQEHSTTLPNMEVLSYETLITPGKRVRSGGKIGVNSVVEVAGIGEARLSEEMAIYDSNNMLVRSFLEDVNSFGNSLGKFVSKFAVTLPNEMPEGKYRIDTILYVDGEVFSKNSREIWVG